MTNKEAAGILISQAIVLGRASGKSTLARIRIEAICKAVEALEKQIESPTVDAVEVVRCKDRKYFKTLLCQNEDNHENWFCADGERK